MNPTQMLIAAAATVSVIGAATFAYAQTTSADPSQAPASSPQIQGQMPQSTTPMSPSPTTPAATDMQNSNTQRDANSLEAERAARADRN